MSKLKKLLFSILLSAVFLCSFAQRVDYNAEAHATAIPGGGTIGIKLYTDGLLVVGLSDIPAAGGAVSPAKQAGVTKGDIITHLNGTEIEDAKNFSKNMQSLGANPISLTVVKNGAASEKTITPVLYPETNEYKLGMWVRDSAAGIGTVTFILSDGSFGALGHGISDIDTGEILKIKSGEVVGSRIISVLKGARAEPGELRGMFNGSSHGTISSNTENGIFGMLDKKSISNEEMEFASEDEVKPGEALIYSNIEGETIDKYTIVIEKIQSRGKSGQNMVIRVTDPRLIQKTGGIVQGMSGSPIIQNGKIAGAVTHVFVNDPTRGYGIFIENMLR